MRVRPFARIGPLLLAAAAVLPAACGGSEFSADPAAAGGAAGWAGAGGASGSGPGGQAGQDASADADAAGHGGAGGGAGGTDGGGGQGGGAGGAGGADAGTPDGVAGDGGSGGAGGGGAGGAAGTPDAGGAGGAAGKEGGPEAAPDVAKDVGGGGVDAPPDAGPDGPDAAGAGGVGGAGAGGAAGSGTPDGAAGGAADAGDAAGAGGCGGSGGQCNGDGDCPKPGNPCMKPVCLCHVCAQLPAADDTACDDGLACTTGETCKAGLCGNGKPKDCSALDGACSSGQCNPADGSCVVAPKNEGALCNDGNSCTWGDKCTSGLCKGTTFADGTACDDGLPCTVGDACKSGVCTSGLPRDCSFLATACRTAACDPASGVCKTAAKNDSGSCDDGNPCTSSDKCQAGECTGVPKSDGTGCDDGLSCTKNDTCMGGRCRGLTVTGNQPVYFSETFATVPAGWKFGPDWQWGPAKASTCATYGSQDPGFDHGGTADEGLVGVIIGGCVPPQPTHPLVYLESPPLDVGGAPGPVVLSYWRWLNSDYTPYMKNTVEVWNGAQWIVLWQSSLPAVQDPSWTLVSHDVTAYKNAALRVRFGFDVSTGILWVSGWNLDDVVVGGGVCQ